MSAYPELDDTWRSWIAENVDRGCARSDMVESMAAAGWARTLAPSIIDQVLREREILATSVPVPEPELADHPSVLRAADRDVRVLLTLESPRLVVFGGLLDDLECDELIEQSRARIEASTVIDAISGENVADLGRISRGMFFKFGETPLVARIESRLAEICRWPMGHSETIQVLHYLPGGKYDPHYDYFAPGHEGTQKVIARAGQRVGTVVMYLNTHEAGGGTRFPASGLEVAAQKGNAVFFSYERPHPSTKTLHAGSPVIRGEKWIATLWFRERALGSAM
ncbi:MAG: 2OG-Fe(II) oxygenase [Betaproteobacteria bacterium]